MSEKLPEGWAEIKLGQIFEFKYGKGLPARKRDNTGHPVYGSNGIVGFHSTPSVERESIIIGRKGSVGEVHLSKEPCSPIDTTYFVDELFGQPIKYWFLFLKSLELGQLNKATAIPGLNRNDAYDLKIKVPPIAEQKRIADKLECLLAKVDACKARLDKVPGIIKRFRQSVLADAVSGKLTEDWRENSKTSDVNRSIEEAEKRKKGLLKIKVKKGWDKHLKLHSIPETWAWIANHRLAEDKSNSICAGPFGTIFKAKDFRVEGVPIIFLRHVKEEGFNQNKPRYMDRTVWKKFHQEYSIYGGELLVTKLGDPPGESCTFPSTVGTAMVTPDVLKMDVDTSIANTQYLKYFFNSPNCKEMVRDLAFGVTRLRIDLSMFKLFPIPTPPIEEQNEVVDRVESLFSFTDQLEAKLNLARKRVDNLTASILSKAFHGELIPQDMNDEPAEILLERIRTERVSLATNKNTNGRVPIKRSGRGKKTKPPKSEAETEPEIVTAVEIPAVGDEEKYEKAKSRLQPVARTETQFEKTEVLQAFRKVVVRQTDIEENTLLRLVGQRLGIQRLSKPIRQELESYIRTAIRRKIIARNGDGYKSATPTINHYDAEELINVLRSVTRKGYEYERGHVVAMATEYLGFDKVSDAVSERMKTVFRLAIRRGEFYGNGIYIGKN